MLIVLNAVRGYSKRKGNGENKLKRREIIKGQKRLVDISNLSLF